MRNPSEPAESFQAKARMQWGIKIPVRDGVLLNATLYLPRHNVRPVPAILTITPYISQTFHDQGVYFAAHGHPFIIVDARGRGNSEGTFQPFTQESDDGYDVVEWLAQQSYCNGQVAMWGGSYGGYNQWTTAKQRPPHLATIVPVASPYVGADVWMRNNICYPYLMQWLTLVSGRTAQDKIFWGNERFWVENFRQWFESGAPFESLDAIIGNPSEIFQEWISHPCQGEYWDRYNPTSEEYSRISIPILTITGIYDSDQPGAIAHYREHLRNAAGHAVHYLVIGPWHHAGTRVPQKKFAGVEFEDASLTDLASLHVQWYAWTMNDGPRPSLLRKAVTYYVTGAGRWRHADTLEAVTARVRTLYLNSTGTASKIFASGELADEPGNGHADEYVYDPADIRITETEAASLDPLCLRPTFPTEDLSDQKVIYAMEGKQLIYHSDPLGVDTEISGFFRLTVWMSIDQPDTDFGVSIYEIDDRGLSLLLTADCMRARYRESLREEVLIATKEPLRYDFNSFTFVSRYIRKGSRLRLVIGPINSIHFQKNYNSGGVVASESVRDARVVKVRLFHGPAHPSVLHVPIGLPGTDCDDVAMADADASKNQP